MSVEFVVPADKRNNVTERLARIQDVYRVRARCGADEFGVGEEQGRAASSGDSGCITGSYGKDYPDSTDESGLAFLDPDLTTSAAPLSTNLQSVWIHLEGSEENCKKAKEYILSLCSNNTIEEQCGTDAAMLDARIPRWEYESGAVIERLHGDTIRVQGTDENIGRAQSLIFQEAVSVRAADNATHTKRKSESGVSQHQNGAITNDSYRTNAATPPRDFADSVPTVDDGDHLHMVQNGEHGVSKSRKLQSKATPSAATSKASQSSREVILALMIKLGFSHDSVEHVLAQVGSEASSNEVLQMLVSLKEARAQSGNSEKEAGESGARVSSRDASDGVTDVDDREQVDEDPYRPVIIDGSNVAMSYGNTNVFDCKGIDTVVMWFIRRGHKVIYVFVPSWRKEQSKPETPIQDQDVLLELEKAKILVWTPSRRVKGRRMVCYDDRYIVKLADDLGGIIVSNDTFRDLCAEKPEYRKVVDERLLMYSFAGNKFMPPDDPLGRHGPSLDNFLRKTPVKPSHQVQLCPYGKRCTYGNKCKYSHPERSKNVKPTSELLMEQDRARQEERLKADMKTRALKAEKVEMPWERLDGGGVSGGIAGHHSQQQGRAATLPLMNQPATRDGTNTVPLSAATQHARSHHHHHQLNLKSEDGGTRFRSNTAPLGIGSDYDQYPTYQLPSHVTSSTHHTGSQPLPNRASMTAPLLGGYPSRTPRSVPSSYPQPPMDRRTAPLTTTPDYYTHQHQGPQAGACFSLPPPGSGRDLPPAAHPSLPSHHFPMEGASLSKDFQQKMSLQSHGGAFEEDRHYSYPLTTPYRGSPRHNRNGRLPSQNSLIGYAEDEGYFSPIDPNIPSPGVAPTQQGTTGYHQPTGSDSANSHLQFMYPGSKFPPPQTTASANVVPPVGHQQGLATHGVAAPPHHHHHHHHHHSPSQYPQHQHQRQTPPLPVHLNPAASPRRISEPVLSRTPWDEASHERSSLADEGMNVYNTRHRGSIGLPQN